MQNNKSQQLHQQISDDLVNQDNEDSDQEEGDGKVNILQPFSVYVRLRPVLQTGKGSKNALAKNLKQQMHVRGNNENILQIFEKSDFHTTKVNYAQYAQNTGEDLSNSYLFDKVFSDTKYNLDVFQSVLQPLIPQLLDGYNTTCFAYGMTGSGKTHTMLGQCTADQSAEQEQIPDDEMSDEQRLDKLRNLGLANLAIQNLFYQMFQRQDEFTYRVRVSYLEIYNESVRDLLADLHGYQDLLKQYDDVTLRDYIKYQLQQNKTTQQKQENSKKMLEQGLKIVEDPVKGVIVQNLQEIPVSEASELMDLLNLGNERRFVANTGANRFSSRSHAIVILHIEGQQNEEISTALQQDVFTKSKLTMIDLAGSERASKTDNKGQRMVEGANINKSLLALGQCINILAEQCERESSNNGNAKSKSIKQSPATTPLNAHKRQNSKGRAGGVSQSRMFSPSNSVSSGTITTTGQTFIPYRDSKLTRLLKDSLGGSTKTVMIACISQLVNAYEETINTLKYANKAKSIMNQKIKNQIIEKEYYLEEQRRIEQERLDFEKAKELMQIQNLQKEMELLKSGQKEKPPSIDNSQDHSSARNDSKTIGRQTPSISISLQDSPKNSDSNKNEELENIEQLKQANATKLQQRKSKRERDKKKSVSSFPQNPQIKFQKIDMNSYLTDKLIPSIVMQYNLRQQIQSQNILLDLKQKAVGSSKKVKQNNEELKEEINKLQNELTETQGLQVQIQNEIQDKIKKQENWIYDLDGAVEKQNQNIQKQEDLIKEQDEENQLRLKENELLQEENLQLNKIIRKMKKEIQLKDTLIEEKEKNEEDLKEQINCFNTSMEQLKEGIINQEHDIKAIKEQKEKLNQQLFDKDQQLQNMKVALDEAANNYEKLGDELDTIRQERLSLVTKEKSVQSDLKAPVEVVYIYQKREVLYKQVNRLCEFQIQSNQDKQVQKSNRHLKTKKYQSQKLDQGELNNSRVSEGGNQKNSMRRKQSLQKYLTDNAKQNQQESIESNRQSNYYTQIQNELMQEDNDEDPYNIAHEQDNDINQPPRSKNLQNIQDKASRSQVIENNAINQQQYPPLRKSANNAIFQKNLYPRSQSRQSNEHGLRSRSNLSRTGEGSHVPIVRSRTNLGMNIQCDKEDFDPSDGDLAINKLNMSEYQVTKRETFGKSQVNPNYNPNPTMLINDQSQSYIEQQQNLGSNGKRKVELNPMKAKETPDVLNISDMSMEEMNEEINLQEQINEREYFEQQIGQDLANRSLQKHKTSIEGSAANKSISNIVATPHNNQILVQLSSNNIRDSAQHITAIEKGLDSLRENANQQDGITRMQTLEKREANYAIQGDQQIINQHDEFMGMDMEFANDPNLITPDNKISYDKTVNIENQRIQPNLFDLQEARNMKKRNTTTNKNQSQKESFKELLSLNDIRNASKDRRNQQQNAVQNLAEKFQNLKNSTFMKDQNLLQNQMRIVDQIGQQLQENKKIEHQPDLPVIVENQRFKFQNQNNNYINKGQKIDKEKNVILQKYASNSNLTKFVRENTKKIVDIERVLSQERIGSQEREFENINENIAKTQSLKKLNNYQNVKTKQSNTNTYIVNVINDSSNYRDSDMVGEERTSPNIQKINSSNLGNMKKSMKSVRDIHILPKVKQQQPSINKVKESNHRVFSQDPMNNTTADFKRRDTMRDSFQNDLAKKGTKGKSIKPKKQLNRSKSQKKKNIKDIQPVAICLPQRIPNFAQVQQNNAQENTQPSQKDNIFNIKNERRQTQKGLTTKKDSVSSFNNYGGIVVNFDGYGLNALKNGRQTSRSNNSKKSQEIFHNYERTAKAVKKSLDHSPIDFGSRGSRDGHNSHRELVGGKNQRKKWGNDTQRVLSIKRTLHDQEKPITVKQQQNWVDQITKTEEDMYQPEEPKPMQQVHFRSVEDTPYDEGIIDTYIQNLQSPAKKAKNNVDYTPKQNKTYKQEPIIQEQNNQFSGQPTPPTKSNEKLVALNLQDDEEEQIEKFKELQKQISLQYINKMYDPKEESNQAKTTPSRGKSFTAKNNDGKTSFMNHTVNNTLSKGDNLHSYIDRNSHHIKDTTSHIVDNLDLKNQRMYNNDEYIGHNSSTQFHVDNLRTSNDFMSSSFQSPAYVMRPNNSIVSPQMPYQVPAQPNFNLDLKAVQQESPGWINNGRRDTTEEDQGYDDNDNQYEENNFTESKKINPMINLHSQQY